jgi:hypothetical protein
VARSCVCRPGSASPEGDLEHGGADAVLVADAHLRVAEPVDCEVLTELAEDELVAPVAVRVELIDVDGALRLRARRDHLGRPRSTFFRRTCRGPCTAFFQIPVKTVRPCQLISRGIPTLTDTSLACRSDIRTQHRLGYRTPRARSRLRPPRILETTGNGPPVPPGSLGSQRRTGAVSDPGGVNSS